MECPHCKEKLPSITCPGCNQEIPEDSLYCLACGIHLHEEDEAGSFEEDDFEEETLDPDFDDRVLCPDGTCTGIIENGRCTECGKAPGRGG